MYRLAATSLEASPVASRLAFGVGIASMRLGPPLSYLLQGAGRKGNYRAGQYPVMEILPVVNI